MSTSELYDKILRHKAMHHNIILVLTKQTAKELISQELVNEPVDIDKIDPTDIWFSGVHVYLGRMDKIVVIEREEWL
jgi:hypothetical protein